MFRSIFQALFLVGGVAVGILASKIFYPGASQRFIWRLAEHAAPDVPRQALAGKYKSD
jgi:hypothetical protein